MTAGPPPHVQAAGAAWTRAMRAGDFEAAWRQTDLIESGRRAGAPAQPWHLRWAGQPFDGRRVLVRCLHGLGDTLQFMRFVPRLCEQAAHVHFLVQPALLDLLRGAPGLGEVSDAWTDDPPRADFEIEVMELAYALRCTVPTLPPPCPHLAQRVREGVRLPIAPRSGLRVGLLWAASAWDTSRSLPLEQLAPLFGVPGVRFYSLQQEDAADDPALHGLPVTRLSPLTRTVPAAAAAMLEMDLVIAVDGMPAHLAGTLARPTWLLLKHDADWRWMEGRTDTPWYPSMRLFRQPRAGDWGSVVADVAAALRLRTSSRSP